MKSVSVFLVFTFLFQLITPVASFALTSGPSTPEFSSFEPLETTKMVDLFSGDFVYNIPLLDVEGYPINISYHSGIGMDQEASWVGLGWNINVGNVNRNVRGVPDDFNGVDRIKRTMHVKTNKTYGLNVGKGHELFGLDKRHMELTGTSFGLNFGIGIKYNNYTGIGFENSIGVSGSNGSDAKAGLTGCLGLRSSSDGLDITASASFTSRIEKLSNPGLGIASGFNSRSGLKYLTLTPKHKFSKFLPTSARIDFANPSYTPQIAMPMVNTAVAISFKFGHYIWQNSVTSDFEGYYSEQKLARKETSAPAYGYLYSENGVGNPMAQLDFNREKDGDFTDHTTNLPVSSFTYDTYSVSGEGNSGMYRPHRSDVGVLHDPYNGSSSDSYNLGLESSWGVPPTGPLLSTDIGADFGVIDVRTNTGEWRDQNLASANNNFVAKDHLSSTINKAQYETVYFKEASEVLFNTDNHQFSNYGGETPVKYKLHDFGSDAYLLDMLEVQNSSDISLSDVTNTNTLEKRQRRNNVFSYLTRGEYSNFAARKSDLTTEIFENPDGKYDHHIAEISVTKPDGSKYIYGIPVYNTTQKEVNFNSSGLAPDANNITTYDPSYNSVNNEHGKDWFYSSTETPANAYSYLLTEVLSSDYVDITGDGPSVDDLGTYTKFNYSKKYNKDTPYKWRTPYQPSTSNFNENLKSVDDDNQSNYVYGEKEVYLLDEIVTKNYTAKFTTAERLDGQGSGEDASSTTSGKSYLLQKIVLTANDPSNTIIKSVYFHYNYSLCPSVPNNSGFTPSSEFEDPTNDGGKLTLTGIYFTYGESEKARLSPYTFEYNNINPSYSPQNYDRWGNYKASATISNNEFPYVDQSSRTTADINAAAWTLSDINLPSGGKFHMTYESDDYAYVQDKIADQMFMIKSCESTIPSSVIGSNSNLYTGNSGEDYLFFKLNSEIDGTTSYNDANALFRKMYAQELDNLYFKFLIKVNQSNDGKEYVNGYIPRYDRDNGNSENFDIQLYSTPGSSGNYDHGVIVLKKKYSIGSVVVNPIVKAALQFARIHTPREAFAFGDPSDDGILNVFLNFFNSSMVNQVLKAYLGPDKELFDKGLGKEFTIDKSWVRLNSPERKKVGGGVRVSKIEMLDNWAAMGSAGISQTYGQQFSYVTTDKLTGNTISSGVASYEPFIGNDENPFRQPVFSHEENALAPDNDFYLEEPFGESFFPSADVGYSKVVVRNLQRTDVKRHATGFTINEFYTAKDFPTLTDRTPIFPIRKKSPALLKLFGFYSTDHLSATQGYSVVTNDMHGKQKAMWVYSEEAEVKDNPDRTKLVSGMEYKYSSSGKYLNNLVKAVNERGEISESNLLGVDFDVVSDMREELSTTANMGIHGNLHTDWILVAPPPVILPIIIPMAWPNVGYDESQFRSSVITKVIHKRGLLSEVIAYDLGSSISTKNEVYDLNTGEVLLSEVKNEYNDPKYSFKYPAYWAYEGMGQASRNIDAVIECSIDNTGLITLNGPQALDDNYLLIPGDEVEVVSGVSSIHRFWVVKNDNSLYLLRSDGAPDFSIVGVNLQVKVLRSGSRNMQSFPIGTIATQNNPVTSLNTLSFDDVLDGSSIIYSEDWKTVCECNFLTSTSPNPYVIGRRGNWKQKKAFSFLTPRLASSTSNNRNLRVDGAYKYFTPFWNYTGTGGPYTFEAWNPPTDLTSSAPNWTWSSEVTNFSPFGFELENRDALFRYSSAQYNFNDRIPTAVAKNAKYKEIGFESFEDLPCSESHFTFNNTSLPANSITTEKRHSGKHSLKVTGGTTVTLIKTLNECNTNLDPDQQ